MGNAVGALAVAVVLLGLAPATAGAYSLPMWKAERAAQRYADSFDDGFGFASDCRRKTRLAVSCRIDHYGSGPVVEESSGEYVQGWFVERVRVRLRNRRVRVFSPWFGPS